MTLSQMRQALDSWWQRTNRASLAAKDSMATLWELDRLYRSFDPQERFLADQVFADWLNAADQGKQWDARVMIGRHQIRSAIPRLEEYIRELIRKDDPQSRAVAEDAQRTLDELIDSLD